MSDTNIEFTIKIKPNYGRVLYYGFWTILSLTFIATMIYQIGSDKRVESLVILTVTVVFIIDLLLIRYILWQLRGREIVSMAENELVITKTGTFWLSNEKYEKDLISKFKLSDAEAFWLPRLYSKKKGKIEFTYMDMTKAFAPTIDREEAMRIIDKLNKRL